MNLTYRPRGKIAVKIIQRFEGPVVSVRIRTQRTPLVQNHFQLLLGDAVDLSELLKSMIAELPSFKTDDDTESD